MDLIETKKYFFEKFRREGFKSDEEIKQWWKLFLATKDIKDTSGDYIP